ncbi:MAG: DUF5723 family protein [Bacteroidales bacterium]|nr:DUF5723 family protein [Bacteroidales bacterium]
MHTYGYWSKNRKLNTLIAGVFLLFLSPGMQAQQANTLFLMHSIPQSNQMNPAVQLKCKWFIGLPVLGTVHVNYSNSAFTYNDLANGTELALDDVYNGLNRMNMVSAEVTAYPVSLGFREGHHYFTFSVADRFTTFNSFPKKFAGMLLYGNARYIGQTARFNNTRINGTYFREYSAGYSRELDRVTTVGARAKLLFGKGSLHTGASRISLGTDEETFALSITGDVTFNSSFPLLLNQNSSGAITSIEVQHPGYLALLMNPRNVGIAADFGVIHEYANDITLSASLLDVGAILWTDELYNINAEVDFIYEGVSEGTDFSAAAYFRDLSDSIASDIIYNVTSSPYVSALPTQLILGGAYRYNNYVTLGGVMRNVMVNRSISSSVTASVNVDFRERFQGSVSWSWLNNTLMNVGAGLAYTGRGMQFYAVTDNFLGFIRPLDTRTVNLRFGMNLMLGCPVKFNRSLSDERSMVPCPPGAKRRFRK